MRDCQSATPIRDAQETADECGITTKVSTIRVSGWDQEVRLIQSSFLIPFAHANGTDFSPAAFVRGRSTDLSTSRGHGRNQVLSQFAFNPDVSTRQSILERNLRLPVQHLTQTRV